MKVPTKIRTRMLSLNEGEKTSSPNTVGTRNSNRPNRNVGISNGWRTADRKWAKREVKGKYEL